MGSIRLATKKCFTSCGGRVLATAQGILRPVRMSSEWLNRLPGHRDRRKAGSNQQGFSHWCPWAKTTVLVLRCLLRRVVTFELVHLIAAKLPREPGEGVEDRLLPVSRPARDRRAGN